MEHQIKTLAAAITHQRTSHLVLSHVKELKLENGHLTILVDNTGPLHELSGKELDPHLQKGLEQVYGVDITYELKPFHHHIASNRPEGESDRKSSRRMSH